MCYGQSPHDLPGNPFIDPGMMECWVLSEIQTGRVVEEGSDGGLKFEPSGSLPCN